LYPKEPLISRTSGVYKQLLCDFTPKQISIPGLIELLRCYYAVSPNLSHSFESYLSSILLPKKTALLTLSNFFTENPLDFSSLKDNILYSSVIHMEVLTVLDTGRTKINVEIDQTASAICFLALLLRNREMAEVSNLLSDTPVCPYIHCMNRFKFFYDSQMKHKNDTILQFLSTDRKVHKYKYALMCWCYGQKYSGRIDDFRDRFILLHDRNLTTEEFKCLLEFASSYDSFIEFIFPNVTKQLKILLDVIGLVVKETGRVRIATLEGEKIWWKRFKHISVTRNGFNPYN
jgi:hypothetical protein